MTRPTGARPPSPLPTPAGTLRLVALGGAVGALIRWGLVETLPISAVAAVLVCNGLGSFLLGVLAGAGRRPLVDDVSRLRRQRLIGTGFCGGLTTLSTVAVDLARRLDGQVTTAAVSLAVTLVVTLGSGFAGLAIGARTSGRLVRAGS